MRCVQTRTTCMLSKCTPSTRWAAAQHAQVIESVLGWVSLSAYSLSLFLSLHTDVHAIGSRHGCSSRVCRFECNRASSANLSGSCGQWIEGSACAYIQMRFRRIKVAAGVLTILGAGAGIPAFTIWWHLYRRTDVPASAPVSTPHHSGSIFQVCFDETALVPARHP
jgi:hypothetical protein